MKGPFSSAQSVIGVLVVLGCFALLGFYVVAGRSPDGFVIAIIAGALSGVTGFYFGHSNGTTSALAQAATTLANRANEAAAVQADKTATAAAGARVPQGPA